jgi:hypothetical protein
VLWPPCLVLLGRKKNAYAALSVVVLSPAICLLSVGDSPCPRIAVPAVSLDDLVFGEGRRAPDLVKMDIERAEREALQGARRLLSEVKPKLLCEVHNPAQMTQIRAYLQQFRYNAEEWKPVHPHYADYHQLYLWALPSR